MCSEFYGKIKNKNIFLEKVVYSENSDQKTFLYCKVTSNKNSQ
jgi:hypothetical protein